MLLVFFFFVCFLFVVVVVFFFLYFFFSCRESSEQNEPLLLKTCGYAPTISSTAHTIPSEIWPMTVIWVLTVPNFPYWQVTISSTVYTIHLLKCVDIHLEKMSSTANFKNFAFGKLTPQCQKVTVSFLKGGIIFFFKVTHTSTLGVCRGNWGNDSRNWDFIHRW